MCQNEGDRKQRREVGDCFSDIRFQHVQKNKQNGHRMIMIERFKK